MNERVILNETQREALIEVEAVCDDYPPDAWIRTFWLSGSKEGRSAKTLRSLVNLGLLEGNKPVGAGQTQWRWRITPAGRAWLEDERRA